MKRTLIWVVAAFIPATALHASSVITCSEASMVTNTCSAAHLTDFGYDLEWNALGPATGIPFTSTATGTVQDLQVSVSAYGGNMILADNYGMISNGVGGWMDPSGLPQAPFRFTGRFDAQPDTAAPGMPPVGNPGDYLIGLYQNDSAMLLGFSQAVDKFAFRVSSNSLMSFDVTITVYASTDGTGTPLSTTTLPSLPGGNCPGLFHVPPQPCNDADWVVGTGFTDSRVGSVVIHTNDTSGFYIDQLYGGEVPEPATSALIGGGLLAAALVARQRRIRA